MPGLNRVELMGYLGRDPEVRYTPKGDKITHFSLAVSRRWKAADGSAREATDWFNIEAWGRQGEICQQYLHKGSLIYLEGRLRTDRYEHEGETRYITKVMLRSMQMLDRREPEEELHEEDDVVE